MCFKRTLKKYHLRKKNYRTEKLFSAKMSFPTLELDLALGFGSRLLSFHLGKACVLKLSMVAELR